MWNARLRLGHKIQDLGQDQLQLCYAEFRKHCIQRHDLILLCDFANVHGIKKFVRELFTLPSA
jgi:hypothetical protein